VAVAVAAARSAETVGANSAAHDGRRVFGLTPGGRAAASATIMGIRTSLEGRQGGLHSCEGASGEAMLAMMAFRSPYVEELHWLWGVYNLHMGCDGRDSEREQQQRLIQLAHARQQHAHGAYTFFRKGQRRCSVARIDYRTTTLLRRVVYFVFGSHLAGVSTLSEAHGAC